VVLISIDGLVPEAVTRGAADGYAVPALEALRDRGSYAEGVTGVYPSLTYPSHTSIVTGARPATHGIMTNTEFAPEIGSPRWRGDAKDVRVPTLLDAARKAGLRTAALSWPVTVGAVADALVPEGQPAPNREAWLKAAREQSSPGLVDAVLASGVEPPTGSGDMAGRDRFFTGAAVHVISSLKPHLLLLHLVQADSAQHGAGRGSDEAKRAFAAVDAHVARIVAAVEAAGLGDRTTFVITGDHGFYRVHSQLQPNVPLRAAGLLTTGPDGRIASWLATAHRSSIRVKDPADEALVARARRVFDELAEGPYRGIFRVVPKAEVAAIGGDSDAAFMLEPIEGYSFSDAFAADAFVVAGSGRGQHGYLPTEPKMRTGLIVAGGATRAGVVVPLARMIDIAPTVGAILGFELPQSEGRRMPGLLAGR
jgi:predicted AlkP superfamily pyrophosphatase or phosphodiesterase